MSAQRRSGRKRAANTRISDLPESSPTQRVRGAPKKRKTNPASTRRAQRQRPATDAEAEDFNNETEEEAEDDPFTAFSDEADPQQFADLLISHLGESEETTVAQETLSSERWKDCTDISAFAKISGKSWVYYAVTPAIVIGRHGIEGPQDEVHIDLGPSKLISRRHAEVYYDTIIEAWFVSVSGRNVVRVNDVQVRRHEKQQLESGSILEVAGTQMLFQLANQPLNVDPFFLARLSGNSAPSVEGSSSIPRPRTNHREDDSATVEPSKDRMEPESTPSRPEAPPRTPERVLKKEQLPSSKKKSPYKRGMLMESTELIDYAADSSKDIKPSCSYASMITWAILSVPDEALSLHGIYEWIKQHYAYYRLVPSGWQNSIRHNLSLNANFVKVPRPSDEPGKGMKWTFVAKNREATIAAANKQASKGGGRTASAPISPASAQPPQGNFAVPERSNQVKTSPAQQSPSTSSYPATQLEVSTPTQGTFKQPELPVYGPTQGALPVLSDETSPVSRRYTDGRVAHLPGSSPTLTSGYGNLDLPSHTPAPRPFNLSLNQPNTAKLPTSHMTPTTPAPFWKPFMNGAGSTPAQFPDSSPAKHGGAQPLSSSPPPAVGNGLESPTRKVGSSQAQRISNSFASTASTGNDLPSSSIAVASSSGVPVDDGAIEEQEGGIDLLKGFTKISAFHQPPRSQISQAQAH